MKYGAAAEQAGCFITSAVGFDCIPADVGAAVACSAMVDRGLQPHTVDSYLVLDWGPAGSCGHFATLCAPPPAARLPLRYVQVSARTTHEWARPTEHTEL